MSEKKVIDHKVILSKHGRLTSLHNLSECKIVLDVRTNARQSKKEQILRVLKALHYKRL